MPNETGPFYGGIGSDVFGEVATGQVDHQDAVNDYMRTKSLKEFFTWKAQNGGFYEGYQKDLNKVRMAHLMTFVYGGAGATFAMTVLNPNFTKRRSWYVRKFNVALFFYIGMAWGKKLESDSVTSLMLKTYDYCPFEVQRTLQTKDFRYMMFFDYKNPDRKLYDDRTGKSI